MDEKLPFQVPGNKLLTDYLKLKSGGKQIALVKDAVQPILDVSGFIYEPVFLQGNNTDFTTGVVGVKLTGGPGIYRIRGHICTSGLNSTTAGVFTVYLTLLNASGSSLSPAVLFNVISKWITTTGVYDAQVDIDLFVDGRHMTEAEGLLNILFSTIPAPGSVTGEVIGYNLMVQRVS